MAVSRRCTWQHAGWTQDTGQYWQGILRMGTNEQIGIGVIGTGGRGSLAGHAHQPDQGARLVAGADIDPAALNAFKDRYGSDVMTTTDYQELLDNAEVDAHAHSREEVHGLLTVDRPRRLQHAKSAPHLVLEDGRRVYFVHGEVILVRGADEPWPTE